ncbi:MAG: lysostaphin resistance A-like protein [Ectobacillus sp.]
MNQHKKIEAMSNRELRLNLYITQLIILAVSILLSFWLFDDFAALRALWRWEPVSIVMYGGGAALLIVLIDYAAMQFFPESWFDDGGINERIFRGMSISHLAFVTFVIGFAEELLFRGILQTHFGLAFASIVFALLHVRYVMKPFLFIFVLLISIAFGYLFHYTGNLFVTVFAHFLVDFIMGMYLRQENEGEEDEEIFGE